MKDVLREVQSQGLSVIPSGKRFSDPWELLKGERFRDFPRGASGAVRRRPAGHPPGVPVSDAIALADLIDRYVLVFRLGYTPHNLSASRWKTIGEKKLLGVR